MKKIFSKPLIHSIKFCILQLKKKSVIAYPTESSFGLGCDPDSKTAVLKLLKLKTRAVEKGFILIAANYKQLIPYIEEKKLSHQQRIKMLDSWPGPISWVVPKSLSTPTWLTGRFNSIAIRVSAHPIVKKLCILFGKPLVSTSANVFGNAPCRTIYEIKKQFGTNFPCIIGKNGNRLKPSEIRNIITNKIIRKG